MKKIISRFMIFAMLITIALGTNITSVATETIYYMGSFGWWYQAEEGGLKEGMRARAIYTNNELTFEFIDSKGRVVKGYMITEPTSSGESISLKSGVLTIDGSESEFNGEASLASNDRIIVDGKGVMENGEVWNLYSQFTPASPPVFHQFSSPFVGFAESDHGNYALSLAGYFEMELSDKVSELTPAEIAEQTIAIVARNHATGETSVIREDTIEKIDIMVSGRSIIICVIRGKVQTATGSLDSYTCVIKP